MAKSKAPANGLPGSEEIKRRTALAAAELTKIQLAEKRGSLIRVEDVVAVVEDELTNVRSRLMTMPGRLSPALVGMTDPAAIETAIRDEVVAAPSEIVAYASRSD